MTGIEQQLEEEARHIMDDSDRKFLQGKKEKAMTADTPDIVDKVKNTLFAANLNIDEAPKLEVSKPDEGAFLPMLHSRYYKLSFLAYEGKEDLYHGSTVVINASVANRFQSMKICGMHLFI